MKKRIISILLVGCMICSAFATTGCGKKASGENGEKEQITLTVTFTEQGFGDDKVFDRFEEMYPWITINEVPVNNNDTKLISMISSGDAPDILRLMGYDELPVFVNRGLLLPLDDYIEESGKVDLSDAHDIVNLCRYDGKERGKGSLYGLPKDWSPIGLWISKSAFADAGIPLPSETEPMSWEEFADTAQKLVKMNNGAVERHGIITSIPLATLYEMQLNSMGDSLWAEDFGETTLETDKTQKVVKYWEDLQRTAAMSGNLYPSADTIGHQALVEGKVGMVLAGYWLCSAFRQYNYIDAASNDLMFVPMPGDGDDKSYTVDVTVAGIFSGTEHPDEAYLLWEYLMCNKETTQLRAASGHGIPTFKSDFECLPQETDFDKQTLETAKAQINTLDLTPKTNPYIPYTSVTNLFDKYYVPYLYGKSTLKEAMQKINYNTKILIGEGKDLMGVD